jgi:periplasmic divalent cation tolerance protein
MTEIVVALTTLPGDLDATPLAQDLIASGLAACVHIVPGVTSVYTWKGVPHVAHDPLTPSQVSLGTKHYGVDRY